MDMHVEDLPQGLVNLEFKDLETASLADLKGPFEKILHRHWKDGRFLDKQKKSRNNMKICVKLYLK